MPPIHSTLNRERYRDRDMAMKVEKITSKVLIKPSTPTPEHLRTFNLSLFDQLSPPVYVPIILFYSTSPTASSTSTLNDHQAHVSDQLKKSLSETLTRFYPLAGRIKNGHLVDCNDEGIEYFESRLPGSNMSDFMKLDQLHHLLPVPYGLHSDTLKIIVDSDPQLIVQINLFDCGGIAICVLISHILCDATTFTTFINAWASINREEESIVLSPTFDSALLYPAREELHSFYSGLIDEALTIRKQAEKKVMRRFLFDDTKIATLRARHHSSEKKLPTRVEAVTALLWKTVMATSTSPKPSIARNVVDMRRRLDPPLPLESFGNLVISTAASSSITAESTSTVGEDLVGPLRESISKINSDYLKVLQGDEGYFKFLDGLKQATMQVCGKEFEVYSFSSFCRLPLYEADYGWGKPNWVTTGGQQRIKNTCILMDNRTGDGIEAMICLREEHMAILERDQELLDFITFLE